MFHPKPVQVPGRPVMPSGIARPRILLGGGGSPRSLRLAARWADEFNTSSLGPAKIAEIGAALDAACVAIGRDPSTMARSAMVGTLIGRDAAEVKTREAALLKAFDDGGGDDWLEERRDRWIIGTPDEARAMVRRFADAGVERIDAPGLPAVGPRHGRRDGRGPDRPGLGLGLRIAYSAASAAAT